MKEPCITISLDAGGRWQATGRLLGDDITVSGDALWDCLEECKQRVWDIEMEHDAGAGVLDRMFGAAGEGIVDTPVVQDGNTAVGSNKGLPHVPAPTKAHRLATEEHADAAHPPRVTPDLRRVVRHLAWSCGTVDVWLIHGRLGIDAAVALKALRMLAAEGSLEPADEHGLWRVIRVPGLDGASPSS